jgi:hypothetical protein
MQEPKNIFQLIEDCYKNLQLDLLPQYGKENDQGRIQKIDNIYGYWSDFYLASINRNPLTDGEVQDYCNAAAEVIKTIEAGKITVSAALLSSFNTLVSAAPSVSGVPKKTHLETKESKTHASQYLLDKLKQENKVTRGAFNIQKVKTLLATQCDTQILSHDQEVEAKRLRDKLALLAGNPTIEQNIRELSQIIPVPKDSKDFHPWGLDLSLGQLKNSNEEDWQYWLDYFTKWVEYKGKIKLDFDEVQDQIRFMESSHEVQKSFTALKERYLELIQPYENWVGLRILKNGVFSTDTPKQEDSKKELSIHPRLGLESPLPKAGVLTEIIEGMMLTANQTEFQDRYPRFFDGASFEKTPAYKDVLSFEEEALLHFESLSWEFAEQSPDENSEEIQELDRLRREFTQVEKYRKSLSQVYQLDYRPTVNELISANAQFGGKVTLADYSSSKKLALSLLIPIVGGATFAIINPEKFKEAASKAWDLAADNYLYLLGIGTFLSLVYLVWYGVKSKNLENQEKTEAKLLFDPVNPYEIASNLVQLIKDQDSEKISNAFKGLKRDPQNIRNKITAISFLAKKSSALVAQLILLLSKTDIKLAAEVLTELEFQGGKALWTVRNDLGKLDPKQCAKVNEECAAVFLQAAANLQLYPTHQLLSNAHPLVTPQIFQVMRGLNLVEFSQQHPSTYYLAYLFNFSSLSPREVAYKTHEYLNYDIGDKDQQAFYEAMDHLILAYPETAAYLIKASLRHDSKDLSNLDKINAMLITLAQKSDGAERVAGLLLALDDANQKTKYAAGFLISLGKSSDAVRMAMQEQNPQKYEIINTKASEVFGALLLKGGTEQYFKLLGEAPIYFLPQVVDGVNVGVEELMKIYPERYAQVKLYQFSEGDQVLKTEQLQNLQRLFVKSVQKEEKHSKISNSADSPFMIQPEDKVKASSITTPPMTRVLDSKAIVGGDAAVNALIALTVYYPQQARSLIAKISNSPNTHLAMQLLVKEGNIIAQVQEKNPNIAAQLKSYIPPSKRSELGISEAPAGSVPFFSGNGSRSPSPSILSERYSRHCDPEHSEGEAILNA